MSLAGEIPSLKLKSAIDVRMPYFVLWIRSGFNADPDPVFYLNADQDPLNQSGF
jgi:hypothetical protein